MIYNIIVFLCYMRNWTVWTHFDSLYLLTNKLLCNFFKIFFIHLNDQFNIGWCLGSTLECYNMFNVHLVTLELILFCKKLFIQVFTFQTLSVAINEFIVIIVITMMCVLLFVFVIPFWSSKNVIFQLNGYFWCLLDLVGVYLDGSRVIGFKNFSK